MENLNAPMIDDHRINANVILSKGNSISSKSKAEDEKLGRKVQQMITKLKKEIYEDGIGLPVKSDRKTEKSVMNKKSDKNHDSKKPNEESNKSGNSVKTNKQKKKSKKKKVEKGVLKTRAKNADNKLNEVVIANIDTPNGKVDVFNRDSYESLSADSSVNDEDSILNEKRTDDPNRAKSNVINNKKPSNQEINEHKLGAELSLPVLNDEEHRMLYENNISPMKNVNPKFPDARFFCRRCDYHCDNIQIVSRHIFGDRHLDLKYDWDIKRTMEHLPPLTTNHETALTALLNNLFTHYHLTKDDLLVRRSVLNRISDILLPSLPDCELQLYGSSLTGFGLKNSDVNIHLHIPQKDDHADIMSKAYILLRDNVNANCKNVSSDFLSKIPAIHFVDNTIFLNCSININNSLAVSTSKLLSLYHSLDPRVPVLSTAFSLWAKICRIDQQSCGTLPSYAFTLMLVHYLQQITPPVLPVIGLNDPVMPDWKSENDMTIGLLWVKLFRYYSVTFNYKVNVINVRKLEPLSQVGKNWHGRRIAIEDPYSGKRNVARSVSHGSIFNHIIDQFKKSYLYFGIPQTIEGPLFKTISVYVDKPAPDNTLAPGTQNENADQSHKSSKDLVLLDEICSKITALTLNDLIYKFEEQTLTHGKFPAIICRLCQQKGHIDDNCPEEKLPSIIPLPPMTKEFIEIINHICVEIMNQYSSVDSDSKRSEILLHIESFIQQSHPDARLQLFGSSCNGFGFHNSDVDICLTFHGNENGEDLDFPSIVENLAERLKKRKDLADVTAITTAKVPIVKFTYKAFDLEVDISLYNTLGLHNTIMLKNYCKIDERLQILGYTMKLFAKSCDIGAAARGSLSSYAYVLMVIYFLQQRNPPVLPVLQEIYEGSVKPEVIVDGWNTYSFQDLDKLPRLWEHYGMNTESVGELWIGLLDFYAQKFDFKNFVISIRQKSPLTRFKKLWNSKCIAIEDPFDLDHNLGGGVSRKMNNYILKVFIKGREIFGCPIKKPPLSYFDIQDYLFNPDVLTDGVLPPHNRGCYICGDIGHKIKECPRKISKKAKKNEKRKTGKNNGLWQENGYQNQNYNRQQQQQQQRYRNTRPQECNVQYASKKGPVIKKFQNLHVGMAKQMQNGPFPGHVASHTPFHSTRPIDSRMYSMGNVGAYLHPGMMPMPITTPSTKHSHQASFTLQLDQNHVKDQLDDPAIVRCISSKHLQQSGPPSIPFPINQSQTSLQFNDPRRSRFHTPHPFQYPHIYNKIKPKNNDTPQPPKLYQALNAGFSPEPIKVPQPMSASSTIQDPCFASVSPRPPPGFPSKNVSCIPTKKQCPLPFDHLNLQLVNENPSQMNNSLVKKTERYSLNTPSTSQPSSSSWLLPPDNIHLDNPQNSESGKLLNH